MTEIYILASSNAEGTTIAGIFTSKLQAQEAASKINKAQIAEAKDLFKDEPEEITRQIEHLKFWSWYKVSTWKANELDGYYVELLERFKDEIISDTGS